MQKPSLGPKDNTRCISFANLFLMSEPTMSQPQFLSDGSEDNDYLLALEKIAGEKTPSEKRAHDRALALIRGRGWPSSKIKAFFLSPAQLSLLQQRVSGEETDWMPRAVSGDAILMPRVFTDGRNETSLTYLLLREMSRARSISLPSKELPKKLHNSLGLYQLSEGIIDLVADRLLSCPSDLRQENPLLDRSRVWAEELRRRSGLDRDVLERMSAVEVIRAIAGGVGWDLTSLGQWMDDRITREITS